VTVIVATLESAGAPKWSRAQPADAEPVTFGVTELAVYLNGSDLPEVVTRPTTLMINVKARRRCT